MNRQVTKPQNPSLFEESSNYNPSREVARGVSWSILMRWAIRFIGLMSTIILARLLSPEDFGITAMGTLVIGLLFAFTEFGAAMLLIRTKEIDRDHCDTAWTISLLQNLLIGTMIFMLAPAIAAYFKEPRVVEVMYVLAFSTIIGGFASIGPTLIRRELKFDLDFRFNIYKKVLVFVATVGLAIFLGSYWALVFGYLIGTIAGVMLSYTVHPYRPTLSLARGPEYLQFAFSIIPMRLASQLHEMAPKFIIGSIGNANIMGAFTVSSGLATLFTHEIVSPMGRGLFPNYARLADDKDRLTALYKNILGMVLLLVIPAGIGISAIASDLVTILLGSQWDMAVVLIEYLAIGGVLYAITFIMYNQILVATGRERQAAILAWIRLLVTVPVLWLGLSIEGSVGLAKATIIAPLIYLPLIYFETRQAVNLSISIVAGVLWRPVLAALAMYLLIKILHQENIDWVILRLACDVLLGACIYIAIVLGLWFLSGKPQGAEHICINLLIKKLGEFPRVC